jgi:cytochrome c peroxidase
MTRQTFLLLALCAESTWGCNNSESAERVPQQATELTAPATAELRARAQSIFGKLPTVMASPKHKLSPEKIELGHMLYFDTRLSRGQELSCASCHDLEGYGVDTRPDAIEKGRSFGHRKQFGDRNSPSTYNAALHLAQFWDGRAPDVEEQAKGPILNPVEMTMADEGSVVAC